MKSLAPFSQRLYPAPALHRNKVEQLTDIQVLDERSVSPHATNDEVAEFKRCLQAVNERLRRRIAESLAKA